MTTLLLDTHVLVWATLESHRLSAIARLAIEGSEELCIASVTWYELAWLVHNNRVRPPLASRSWLDELSGQVRTVPITPAIAESAVSLSGTFPGDPIDRTIYATALEYGWPLVTKDERIRTHASSIAIW